MNALFRKNKAAQRTLLAIVLLGASSYAVARMGPNTTRTIPFIGELEQNGAAANGDYLMRFGLFVAPPDANTAQCVVNDNCPNWSEEQLVTVTNGRFSVLLGDSDGDLTDSILSVDVWHLAMAVKPAADPGPFVLLAGSHEIIPQPWAARAANGYNFRVRNTLTVDNGANITGAVTVSGAISAGGNIVSSGNIVGTGVSATNGLSAPSITATTVTVSNYVDTTATFTDSLTVTNGLPITVSGEYGAVTGAATNTTMTSATRSVCFTTRNVFNSACTIYSNGTNWILETWTNSDCKARCISW